MSVSSTGSKNQPQFDSSGNSPTFAADLEAVSDYAADYGNYRVGTTTDRGSFTPWKGVTWFDTDQNVQYVYNGSSWVPIGVVGVALTAFTAVSTNEVSNGSTLGTLSLSAAPVARRIVVELAGVLGFSGSTQALGVGLAASAGTLTQITSTSTINVATPSWAPYARIAYVDLPASTALTVTMTSVNATAGAYFRFMATARSLLPGQY